MPTPAVSLSVRSAAFADGAEIPMKHTCEGADVSPSLEWSGVPGKAQSLASSWTIRTPRTRRRPR